MCELYVILSIYRLYLLCLSISLVHLLQDSLLRENASLKGEESSLRNRMSDIENEYRRKLV